METEALYITGSLIAIFFQNPSNFYKVMLIGVEETNTPYEELEIVVTGSFGDMIEGETYQFIGHLVDHPKYGKQFQVETYKKIQPTTENGLVEYLSSDKFPGIGHKTAEKIVETLGDKVIDIIMNEPERLLEVDGMTKKRQQVLTEGVRENYGMEQVIVSLHDYGFGSQLSMAIYQKYKGETLELIQENPYRLCEEIEGIGFKKADQLADNIGIEATSSSRIQAAIQFELLQGSLNDGNTYQEAEELLERTINLLENSRPVEITPDLVAEQIIQLVDEAKIQQEGTKLFENSLYFSEYGIATSIKRLLSRKKRIKYEEEAIDTIIAQLEKQNKMRYGNSQILALKEAIRSPLFVLTGGPGTGKTTVINGIVSLFAGLNDLSLDINDYHNEIFPILLAAPTGRAAKRMNETTGLPASTIHRLLGLNAGEKINIDEIEKLEGGLLIVDEMSMVDTWMANMLLKAIPTNMQVIFVGDKDQLPSVGPGQVLHDFLQVEEIPSCELTDIYRQGDGSTIISLAHGIKNGKLPADLTKNQPDRSFFACSAVQIEPIIRQIVTKAQTKGFTAQDIQVLAPMYRGVAGIDNINTMMQEIFNDNPNGSRKEVKWNDKVYRIGDKILQLVNEPELNVFNGDMGVITGIIYAKDSENKVDELVIQFDQNEVTYGRNEWSKITLAYCCSIHKSQGSEFKMVIIPMVNQYSRMLQRNLLYTGITRSKELLIMLGEPSAFVKATDNEGTNRLTYLLPRIVEALELDSNVYIETKSVLTSTKQTSSELASEPVAEDASGTNCIEETGVPDKQHTDSQIPVTYMLTEKLVVQGTISPLIGMVEGITPYDFEPNK
ncbi:SF1B family DNA helicase RecD2 [Vagococcus zengguangii]|uniref:SF1B family DNA helicase RecD2 n=1 Tax=Vagococcus zengguangii TaxID=2571750 RepID=UPI00110847DF|nr:ATP-dependent RecD-like DNA helicase [Vagococcus zengguangii]TLG80217.1 ATP-dependent RecD-like DNA helicase [Vagococcus zengguangii]